MIFSQKSRIKGVIYSDGRSQLVDWTSGPFEPPFASPWDRHFRQLYGYWAVFVSTLFPSFSVFYIKLFEDQDLNKFKILVTIFIFFGFPNFLFNHKNYVFKKNRKIKSLLHLRLIRSSTFNHINAETKTEYAIP